MKKERTRVGNMVQAYFRNQIKNPKGIDAFAISYMKSRFIWSFCKS